uniref:Uncharacterized protein n=1 Tax=Rhizophora mucronata TaxID=61149 RepID=A0A2P2KP64_RHIMU
MQKVGQAVETIMTYLGLSMHFTPKISCYV